MWKIQSSHVVHFALLFKRIHFSIYVSLCLTCVNVPTVVLIKYYLILFNLLKDLKC